MKRLVLVMLVGLGLACGDISDPPDRPTTVTATVEGSGRTLGAVLLDIDVAVDSVSVTGGKSVLSQRNGRSYVAAVLRTAGPTVTVRLRTSGGPIHSITVVQASDGDDSPYADPGSFTVTTRED